MDYKFTLSTDSTADLYKNILDENLIESVPLTFVIEKNGKFENFTDNFKDMEEYKNFYRTLRGGAYSRTSMLNYESHYSHFLKLAQNGAKDVVHFTISSGLSPTVDVANSAAADIKKLFPNFNVYAIDSLSATVGQGVLVKVAAQMRNQGKTAAETAQYSNYIKNYMQHFVVASDLYYLKRGGRISGANAVIGSMLSVKPILSFDREGKLAVIEKARGFKKAFSYIYDRLIKLPPAKESYLTIVHTDAQEKAAELKAFLEEKGFNPDIICMGPVIGSHVGPDSVSIGYISDKLRNEK